MRKAKVFLIGMAGVLLALGMIGCDQGGGEEEGQAPQSGLTLKGTEAGVTYAVRVYPNPEEEAKDADAWTEATADGKLAAKGETTAEGAEVLVSLTAATKDGSPFAKTGSFLAVVTAGETERYAVALFIDGSAALNLANMADAPETPDYRLALSQTETLVFADVNEGYPAQAATTITVSNTGKKATGKLTLAVAGDKAGSFTLNRSSISNIAVGKKGTFTVKPALGLSAGTYTATVSVSGSDGISEGFDVSFEVKPAGTPIYGIELSETGTYAFPPANAGYGPPTARAVTIKNTGNQPTGSLTLALSGNNSGSFGLSKSTITNIAVGKTDSFTVVPNTGLQAGTYTATVSVSGDNEIEAGFGVSFEVKPAGTPIYGIDLSETGTYAFPPANAGYGPPTAKAVTIKNTGNQPTGSLAIGVTGGNFALSKSTIANIAVNGSDSFTVVPAPDLAVGTHGATVTVSGSNGISAGFDVSFEVKPAGTPIYGIELSETETLVFEDAVLGYGDITPQTITVTNSGNQPTGGLTIGVSSEDFTLSKQTIDSIDVEDEDSFTVVPNTGLSAGTYTATVTVSGNNGISAGFDVSFVVNIAPVYGIELSPTGPLTFEGAVEGYEAPDAETVTISNTGNQPTGELTVALTGAAPSAFTLDPTTIANIDVEDEDSFTVVPNTGLSAGTYTATVTVSGNNGISAGFDVSFVVNIAPVYGIELSPTGPLTFEGAVEGYEAPDAETVTISNTGNQPTGSLTLSVTGGNFALSKSTIANIAVGKTDSFTVVPNTGLSAGTYTATVTVSGSNGISAGFDVSFVVNIAPVYSIELSPTGPLTFEGAIFGYEAQEPLTVTIINIGDQPTGALTLSVSNGDFILNKQTIDNIAVAGGTAEFTVKPNTGLAAGTHTATVTVSGSNGISAGFDVSFEVIAFSPSYLTLAGGTTVEFGRADLDALCTGAVSTDSITVNGQSIVKNTIVGAVFGSDFTDVPALPDKFCRFFTNLTALDISGFTSLTSLGEEFLFGCGAFNQRLELPEGLTAIADGFLSGCSAFNQPLELPESLTAIGEGFLSRCSAFNRPVTIPAGVTTIEGSFMYHCTVFNQPLTLPPGITSVGDWFLASCEAFNQPVALPSVTTIGMCFMYGCAAFNESLTITSVTTIGNQFLYRCSLFNRPLELPSSLTTIDLFFLYECHAFNKPLTIPATVTSIGHGFVANCHNMTSTVTINCPASAFTASDFTGYNFATNNAEAPCYTTGMTIAGPYAAAIIERFPTGTAELAAGGTFYRRLIAGQ